MRLDVRNMTQQQIADANNQWLAQNSQPFTGQPKRPMQSDMGAVGAMPLMPMLPMGVPPMGVPPMGFGPGVNNFGTTPSVGNPMQDAFQQFLLAQGQGAGGMPSMGVPPMDRPKQFAPQGYTPDPSQVLYRPPPAGGTGMPPMGGGLPYNNGFNNPGQPQQPMTQPAVGTPFNKPTGPQVQPPMAQPPAGGGTGTSPQPYNNGFYNPGQPPMAMKKGGFAVKAVWDKKRPKDLGEPKDLSVKRKKSAKARAKAAGRPYPNLVDNLAAARSSGK